MFLVMAVGLSCVVSAVVYRFVAGPVWTTRWTLRDGPAPDDFLYLMYPEDEGVPVLASAEPDAPVIGTLGRAMINAQSELGGAFVPLRMSGGATGWVDRESLGFTPAPGRGSAWREALRAFEASEQAEPYFVGVDRRTLNSERTRLVLERRYEGSSRLRWVYDVTPGGVEAVRHDDMREAKVGLEGAAGIVAGGIAWPIAFATLMGAGCGWRRQGRGRAEDPALCASHSGEHGEPAQVSGRVPDDQPIDSP